MTRLMVLGLLTKNSMSGYEMQQILQQSQTDTWTGILPGSIYHAFKTMEKEGLVEIEAVQQTGHRTKAVYRITDRGREEFIRMLEEALRQSSVTFPTTTYTAVTFLNALPRETILEALAEQRRTIEEQYALMKAGEKKKVTYKDFTEIVQLSFQNMYDHYEIQLKFLSRLEEIIRGHPDLFSERSAAP
ncbi:helix-turn-helix transcriptional regulator [Paenibacillus sp. J2TS4]|uniref:helix-turn-helix transcriptional regulator n=1 Tax=Paenibacillus sp. J2TS4 TaxID=2807194 RepID=UPI001B1DBC77|nr:helix-turn-helix transcriptional regulator [Paenibacillus sp. J2TS4]GIP31592.1 PadR family transcriptional regulator [Paenibacillus sp. J2TS4]